MRFNVFPDHPALGIGNVGAKDFWVGVNPVGQVYGNPQSRCVTVELIMKCDAPSMPFLPRYCRPVEITYPTAYPFRTPSPAYVNRIGWDTSRNDIDARALRQHCPFAPLNRFGKVQSH
jgi:hypothetical protein